MIAEIIQLCCLGFLTQPPEPNRKLKKRMTERKQKHTHTHTHKHTHTDEPDSRWSLLKRRYFVFCFAHIISNTQIIIIIINPGHFMQTAEWTLEYSAFGY